MSGWRRGGEDGPAGLPAWTPDARPAPLPDDLERLGRSLELAATRRMRARRRWRVVAEACLVCTVGPALALSTSAVDVSPASGAVAPLARSQAVWPKAPSLLPERGRFAGSAAARACFRDADCQRPSPTSATPFSLRPYE